MPTLLESTEKMLAALPRWVTLSQVASESGVKLSWLSAFASGGIEDPGVKKVQAIHDYLSVLPTNTKPSKIAYADAFMILPGSKRHDFVSAVYEIHAEDQCLYVGSTGNFGLRIRQHRQKKKFDGFNPCFVVLSHFEDGDTIKMQTLERAKIKALRPVLNVKGAELDV